MVGRWGAEVGHEYLLQSTEEGSSPFSRAAWAESRRINGVPRSRDECMETAYSAHAKWHALRKAGCMQQPGLPAASKLGDGPPPQDMTAGSLPGSMGVRLCTQADLGSQGCGLGRL